MQRLVFQSLVRPHQVVKLQRNTCMAGARASAAGVDPSTVAALREVQLILGSSSSSRRGILLFVPPTPPTATNYALTVYLETPRGKHTSQDSRHGNPVCLMEFSVAVIMDELAESLGFEYRTASADIDEQAIRDPDPRRLVLLLAHAKADAIIAKLSAETGSASLEGVLITCDQVVVSVHALQYTFSIG